MSGLTSLVDTLLATRLAQRVDLVPLKPAVELAGPGAVAQVEEVSNDVRLPSRAAMLQQLGQGLLTSDQRGHGGAQARAGESVSLSVAARAVGAILEGQSGATSKILGTEALLPSSSPIPHQLSAVLARTVANSGLFYESHLQQFAAGTRTLAQMAQEPQARLDASLNSSLETPIPGAAGQVSAPDGVGDARAPSGAMSPPAAPASADKGDAVPIQNGGAASGASTRPLPGAAGASQDTSHLPSSSSYHAGLHERSAASIDDTDAHGAAVKNHAARSADATPGNAPGLAGIHPDAIALVRQQLELLAVPVFRWSGEASPGTPMDWEIREEPDEPEAAAAGGASTRTWSTRLALTLPTLRDVEVRVSLAGSVLQVHLAASEGATLALLRESGSELPARLGQSGLQLASLQIGRLVPGASGQDVSGAGDAG